MISILNPEFLIHEMQQDVKLNKRIWMHLLNILINLRILNILLK